MSKLVPNIVDTARILRGQDFVGKFSSNFTSICLSSRVMAFEISKHYPRARFFADREMIAYAGGPWFIQSYKDFLSPQLCRMAPFHMVVKLGDIEAKDLFSYRTCNVELDFNHSTRPNPIALQLVQKAMLFAIADEILERQLNQL